MAITCVLLSIAACDDSNGRSGPGGSGGGGTGGHGGGGTGGQGTGAVGAGGQGADGGVDGSGGGTGGDGTGGMGGTGGMTPTCDNGFVWDGARCVAQSNDCSPACGAHGTCAGGQCVCATGYTGAVCDACAQDFYLEAGSGACLASMCVPGACNDGDNCAPATGLCCDGACEASRVRVTQWGGAITMHARAVAAGSAQQVYIAGDSDGAFEGADHAGSVDHFLFLTDADATGPSWVRQWGSTGPDRVGGAVRLSGGDIVVAGQVAGAFGGESSIGKDDIAVVRHGADGSPGWGRILGTAELDEGWGVAADGNGYLYVAGATEGDLDGSNQGSTDVAVYKLNAATGATEWARRFGGAGADYALAVDATSTGDVFLAGSSAREVTCWKLNAAGEEQWSTSWGSSANDKAYGVVALPDGGAAVVGGTAGLITDAVGGGGAFISRLGSNGDVTYTHQFGGSISALARAVEIGADGDLYVAGEVSTQLVAGAARGKLDGFARRLKLDGTPVWTEQWGTAESENVYGLALGGDGTVYVVGGSRGAFPGFTAGTGYDAYLAVIAP